MKKTDKTREELIEELEKLSEENCSLKKSIQQNIIAGEQIQQELTNRQSELKAIYDYNPVMMCVMDENRRILYANIAFTTFTGISEAELKGGKACGVFGCINSFDNEQGCGFGKNCSGCSLLKVMKDTFLTGNGHRDVEYHSTLIRNGTTRIVYLLGSTTLVNFNGVKHLLLCLLDITAQKIAEETLRQSEAKFRSYFELPLIGIAISSPDKSWIEVNKGVKEMLGYSMEELVGITWAEITHPDDLETDVEEFNKVLTDQKDAYFLEKRFIHKNGDIIWTNLSVGCVRKPDRSVDYMVVLIQNISKRKLAEESLKESEAQFQDLYENAPDMYLSVNPKTGKIEQCNQTTVLKTGFNKHEIIGKTVLDMYHPNSTDAAKQAFQTFLSCGEVHDAELLVTCKDGSAIDVSLNVTAIKDKNGNIRQSRSSWRDITERKRAEDALQESEQRFRNNMEHVKLISAMLDTNGNITFANNYFLQITGWKREEVLGQNWFKLFVPPETELRQILFQNLDKGLVPDNYQNEILTRSGERRLIDWNNTLVRDAHGNIAGIAGIGIDVTEQKRAEEAIIKSEEKYRLITENTADVIWILNLDKQKFTFISPSIYNLRGYTVEEAMSQSLGESLTPDSEKSVTEIIQKTLPDFLKNKDTTNSRQINEVKQLCKNGDIIWVEIASLYQFNSDGEVEVLGISRNIENRKKMEEELRKSEGELKETNSQKDKFFSIIAHDLKSPFNSILGFSEMLKDEARNLDIDSIVQYASIINSSAQHTFELLENLLEWARMQQGRIPFEPKSFLLNSIVISEFDGLKNTAEQKNISLVNNIHRNIIINADENMILTVIRNLISNAIKFTQKNGIVSVEAEEQENLIQISVSDTGVGMKPETIGKLFKIQTSFTTRGTENEKGTGLGLLLCKDFIEKHGGKIWVKSEPGKGSIFTFTIPFTSNEINQ